MNHPSSTYVNNLNISENFTQNGRFSSHLGGFFILDFIYSYNLCLRRLLPLKIRRRIRCCPLLQTSIEENRKRITRSISIYLHCFLHLLLGVLHGMVKWIANLDRWSNHDILWEGRGDIIGLKIQSYESYYKIKYTAKYTTNVSYYTAEKTYGRYVQS